MGLRDVWEKYADDMYDDEYDEYDEEEIEKEAAELYDAGTIMAEGFMDAVEDMEKRAGEGDWARFLEIVKSKLPGTEPYKYLSKNTKGTRNLARIFGKSPRSSAYRLLGAGTGAGLYGLGRKHGRRRRR